MSVNRSRVASFLVVIFISGLLPNVVRAYTPESPKVQAMLGKAVAYYNGIELRNNAEKLGGESLVGLALYKYQAKFGDEKQLPGMTKDALERARAIAKNLPKLQREDNYSLGITLIFLTEVRPQENGDAIRVFLNEMLRRQQRNGGWGYNADTTDGDTSQTQYAVLGMWAAYNAGHSVPVTAMEKVAYWLIRTQDPSGAFGYQGRDPGNYNRVRQSEVRLSLCAAGLGSVYVAGDFLGMSKQTEEDKKKNGKRKTIRLPPALIPVAMPNLDQDGKKKKRVRIASAIDTVKMQETMALGNGWFAENYRAQSEQWQYYYMYGLERYQAFKELNEAKFNKEPQWYNDGVDLLGKRQSGAGSFGSDANNAGAGPEVDTAFAMLFLMRSTRDSISKVAKADGQLRGGYGLPTGDLSNVKLTDDNKIIAPAITSTVEEMVKMLEEGEDDKIENMLDHPDALSLTGKSGKQHVDRLRRIVRSGSFEARLVAVRAIAKLGELDNVPILIYALTDPDPKITIQARDGLRLASRRFNGVGLNDRFSKEERAVAVDKWKQWYKSVRPDAVFIKPGG